MDVVRTIRNLRAEMNVAAGKRTRLMMLARPGWEDVLEEAAPVFARLAGVSETTLISAREQAGEKTATGVTLAGELFIPLGDLVDYAKEIARLKKELDAVRKDMERAEGKLSSEGFLAKAPAQLVDQEREKLAKNREKAESLEERIRELSQEA